ncbi:MAG TPA: 30S ribosome-binding factor RbfA [Rhodospirillaceae bacterium]|nr:MAG: ribosome-binding factor A [Alphaproteobacteria bacterium GWF2_58_20]HAU29262.1 30S ribosome-binding factor RbfA [Rhodospirillaceae bacterium]
MRHARKTTGQRPLRVGEQIRHLLSEVLERGNFRDPVLAENSITVSEVRMSPDLKHAKIFVMPLGGRNLPKVLEALERAEGMFRAHIAQKMKLRYLPYLHFEADITFDEASHIDSLLRRPEVARDLENPAAGIPDETDDSDA